jgi:hypothetical protein
MTPTPTKKDFENHTGNVRIIGISFDSLTQMWEGCNDEYNPKTEEPQAKFYIGKIGKYSDCSYIWNSVLSCASICVTFSNGYEVMCTPDDVVFTDEEMTWEEYLPHVPKPGEDTNIYKPLTDAQKEFADKIFLQMIAGQPNLKDKELRNLLDYTISLSQYRTRQHKLLWSVSWLKELDDDE